MVVKLYDLTIFVERRYSINDEFRAEHGRFSPKERLCLFTDI